MIKEGELEKTSETETVITVPCFRMASLAEVQLLDHQGFLTRAIQDRDDHFSPSRKQDKLDTIIWEYLENHAPESPETQHLLNVETSKTEFITQGLALITGLEPDDNEIIGKIARGEATAQEIRIFFATFAPKNFNVVVQTATTTPFSNFLSLTYGGVLNTHIPAGCVLLELNVPAHKVTFDQTSRNSMENELLVEKIEVDWVVGRYTTSEEVVELLKRRPDLPVQRFLQGIDFNNTAAVNAALHQSKRLLLSELLESTPS